MSDAERIAELAKVVACVFCGATSYHIAGDEMSGYRTVCDWEECGASGPIGETRKSAWRLWVNWRGGGGNPDLARSQRDTAIRERDAARDAVKLLRGALEALRQVTIPPQDISGRRMYDGAVEALAATASIPTEQEPPA